MKNVSMNTVTLDEELLLSVLKPARYIGGEVGSVRKEWDSVGVHVALCFPDIYEIGMSHQGLRVLYDVLNRRPDCSAERVFSPWVDMEERLREKQIPLFSLESRAPVRDFDILGFSLQYELNYTNVLNILSLSGIPLCSCDRDANHPLVIAGGHCCLNPEPLSDFIDVFVIGEAEEALAEVVDVFKKYKESSACDRKNLLKALSRLEGVYVPSFYRVDEETGQRIALEEGAPLKISKRFVKDLEKVLAMEHWVVPYIEIVHDRIGIEIMRGCPNACDFCQARSAFYPLRMLSQEKILETARRLAARTGYEEISLLSLSSSDHPQLFPVVQALADEFRKRGTGFSLPSVRAKNVVGELSSVFSSTHKASLTFAPEAGSERLRRLLNKNLDMQELFDVCRQAYQAGYRLLKLYFMIGLPSETQEDLDEIERLCVQLSRLKKEVDGHPAHLNVSISNFIPKPHTLFERHPMASVEALEAKQEYLRRVFKKTRGFIRLKFHRPAMSVLEAVLSRGGRRLGRVIAAAHAAGARFDAWPELFNFNLWQEAFSCAPLSRERSLAAGDPDTVLPWDFIDCGVLRQAEK